METTPTPQPTAPVVEHQIAPAIPARRGVVLVLVLVVIVVLVVFSSIISSRHAAQRQAKVSAPMIAPVSPAAVAAFGRDQDAQAAAEQARQQRNRNTAPLMAQSGPQPFDETEPQHRATAPAASPRSSYGDGESVPRERKRSDIVVIDFSKDATQAAPAEAQRPTAAQADAKKKSPEDPMAGESYDHWDGKLYRVFEGTVLEGVIINRVDGAQAGPVTMMLTKDLYSHNNEHLLLPAGTRVIGSVKSVSSEQQRKLFVSFDHAICPDGFELDFDKFLALDQMGTSGLATKVNHQYLQAFAAALAVGGIGGLAEVGNSGSVFNPQTEVINGVSSETGMESQEILNHFLNRLPIITLKEGSRAEVYIGVPLMIPSNDEHRMDPNI